MNIDAPQLLLLLTWMSPAFPIGGFAYSHGLEAAIESGDVQAAADLKTWLEDLLVQGSAWNDAVIMAQCWEEDAAELNELALALAPSCERWMETRQLGTAFRLATEIFLPPESCGWPTEDLTYPVAAGVACRQMGIAREAALLAFLQGFCASLISVAVRLVPMGQSQGLEVLRGLMVTIVETAIRASLSGLDDLGSFAPASDISAIRHETLQPRIFRT